MQKRHATSVTHNNRSPFDTAARCYRLRRAATPRCYAPDMTAIDIALVRRVDDCPAVRGHGNVLDFKFARRQQRRFLSLGSRGRNRIEMCPSIFLPGKYDVIVRRPEEL